ncbi:hypothetical protein APT_02624 [Acetobacter pasteurianus NBRC 101655]|uniref:Accessory factor UbiK family protein n=6 Tax=Acetobacter TaxID=434 RepID=C7JH01_ACEP3|nr:hypothetical protein APA01_26390 [Acetobacter pasteurianus IFO 3283-01]BAI03785.1 hypothetical protein APA03_26390 [Acetobacter pasteurianus IFO 3283-03]BAI06832.1 hypothetical protein APA07_26390 [Acetobacter pasteurianus IFO 3283-07]BAI09880.1 hypothetical protein APA22_26390 [Acetobacter pasteurianus IFO 3283-22]BAI12928.1 hypothetical protein APA26_26390 [Acetobacter pasteurianus IFO 3283-26]BAI15974.1 hypothetical protein APA32_26390 [Acetobacter pasteurianus IFO 3283-32]BAI18957.1 hy
MASGAHTLYKAQNVRYRHTHTLLTFMPQTRMMEKPVMADKPRFFDDLAGVAGGAFSALTGVREEIHAIVRSRVDEVLTGLQVVRREEFEVMRDLAAQARIGQEEAERRLAALEERVTALEHKLAHNTHEHGHQHQD